MNRKVKKRIEALALATVVCVTSFAAHGKMMSKV